MSIEKQQVILARQKELMADIKNTVTDIVNGIEYEDEFYTQLLDKIVVYDKDNVDVYLKMLPQKCSYTIAKASETGTNSISETDIPISVNMPCTSG